MKCISAINPVPGQPGKDRMDLHCYNREDPKSPNMCRARAHMGVITEDPKEWVCHEYNLSFKHNENLFYLIGYDKLVDPYFQRRPVEESYTILSDVFGREMVKVNFVPISTGDDMHERAYDLFHSLPDQAPIS
jgi:hypothetical protein